MRIGVEIYKCDKCKQVHHCDFPIAESAEEYNKIIVQLPRPFAQFDNGECRCMVKCGIGDCAHKNGEPILGKSFVFKLFE